MNARGSPTPPAGLDPQRAIEQYDRLAPVYDLWTRLFEGKAAEQALRAANVRDGQRVLEVATGTGAAFARLARANAGGLTVGVDGSRPMAVRARRRAAAANVRTVVGMADCRSLPFGDESFDLVFSSYLLDLLSPDDTERTVSEFRRVLHASGRLVLVCMTHDGPLMRAWAWVYRRWPELVGGCRSVLTAPIVERAGFGDVRRDVVRQLGFPSEVVTGVRT